MQVIKSENSVDWEREIIDYVNQKVRNGQDVSIPMTDGSELLITGRTAWKLGYRNGKNEGNPISDKIYLVKGTAAGVIDEIVQTSKYLGEKGLLKPRKNDFAQNGFEYRSAYFRDLDGGYYRLSLSVGLNENSKEVYNIGAIKKVPFPVIGSKASTGTTPYSQSITQNATAVNTSISKNAKNDTHEKKFSLNDTTDAKDAQRYDYSK